MKESKFIQKVKEKKYGFILWQYKVAWYSRKLKTGEVIIAYGFLILNMSGVLFPNILHITWWQSMMNIIAAAYMLSVIHIMQSDLKQEYVEYLLAVIDREDDKTKYWFWDKWLKGYYIRGLLAMSFNCILLIAGILFNNLGIIGMAMAYVAYMMNRYKDSIKILLTINKLENSKGKQC